MREDIRKLFADPQSPLFTHVVKGGSPRTEQSNYADAVDKLIALDHGLGLLQGETGCGKTVGYLVPAALEVARTGKRLVISTHTISLQNQVMAELERVADLVAAMTGVRLKAARRIGRRNFISAAKLRARALEYGALAKNAVTQQERARIAELANLLLSIADDFENKREESTRQNMQEAYGAQLSLLQAPPKMLDGLEINHGDDDSGYRMMLEASREADIQVVNHALLATHLISFGRVLFDKDDKREHILIVDEADELPGMVRSLIQHKLPINDLRSLARTLAGDKKDKDAAPKGTPQNPRKRAPKRPKTDLEKAIDEIANEIALLEDHPNVHESQSDGTGILTLGPRITLIATQLHRNLKRISSRLADYIDAQDHIGRTDLEQVISDIGAVTTNLEAIQKGGELTETTSVYWTPLRNFAGFHIDGGNPGAAISRLWRLDSFRPATVLFTSATLSAAVNRNDDAVSMRDFSSEIGLSKEAYARTIRRSFSPENFGSLQFVVVDQRTAPMVSIEHVGEEDEVVRISNPAVIDWWAGMATEAAGMGGRVLALTLSYSDAEKLAVKLLEGGQTSVHLDRRGDGGRALEAFRSDPRGVLVTPSRWSGLDMPGMIKHVLITRLPLSPPDVVRDAVRENYLRNVRKMDLNHIKWERFRVSLANARRKLAQGIGRAIRKFDDDAIIWIGDRRWPVPEDRRFGLAHVYTPTWASTFVGAVATRFTRDLNQAKCFTLDRGAHVFELEKTEPRTNPSGPRSKIVKRQ